MAQNAYVGCRLAVRALRRWLQRLSTTSRFTSTANPGPTITRLSATTGPGGSPVTIVRYWVWEHPVNQYGNVERIAGHGEQLERHGHQHSDTQFGDIGQLVVSVAPGMDDSNPYFLK